EEPASPVGSDKVAEEEGEDLDEDEEEYDEEEDEEDDDRPRKKPKHGGFILDEADVDDEDEDEDRWSEGGEDILEKGTYHREEAQGTAQDTLGTPWAAPGGGVWGEGSLGVLLVCCPCHRYRIKWKDDHAQRSWIGRCTPAASLPDEPATSSLQHGPRGPVRARGPSLAQTLCYHRFHESFTSLSKVS
ncbi:hypothetical protein ATANTOWER_024871, partial [Ataeniobius toweri]|nr:hypothetical protein [Ataeniobius toweri]